MLAHSQYFNPIADFSLGGRLPVNIFIGLNDNHRPEKRKQEVPAPVANGAQNHSLLVLLADDDMDDRDLFADAIKEQEMKVQLEFAEDGGHLLTRLEDVTKPLPDLLFLDLNMPNKSGIECLDYIRKSERLRHISVIIYSTSSSHNDINETFEKGANLYVRKPTTFKDLLLITKKVLLISWDEYRPNTSRNSFVFPANIH